MNRFQRHIIHQQIVALRVLTFALVFKRLIELLPQIDTDEDYNTADQLVSENGVTYSYDLNGNLVTKSDSSGVTGYTYDYDNRLSSVSSPSGTVSYKYDADGNRVEQATSSVTTRYLVDTNRSLAQVLAEYTPSAALIASYVYADDLISMARGGQLYFYHFDGIGSTRLLTDGGGNVTDTYSYDAFGNLIARTGTTENPFLFTGQQYDANTGFYYLRARYYQPTNGRFTAYDPFEGDPYAPMSLHKYLYAAADPVNKIDPSGLYTSWFGYQVEAVVCAENRFFYASCPNIDCGKWGYAGANIRLKPDIFNRNLKIYNEVKPFTLTGIYDAELQMFAYRLNYDSVGYFPDFAWEPPQGMTIASEAVYFKNIGGVIFYSTNKDKIRDAQHAKSFAEARQAVRTYAFSVIDEKLERMLASAPSKISQATYASMTALLALSALTFALSFAF